MCRLYSASDGRRTVRRKKLRRAKKCPEAMGGIEQMAQVSFGRKWLSEIIRNEDLSPEEKENQIMSGHINVTDGLKDRIEALQTEADKAASLQKEIDKLKADGGDLAKIRDEYAAYKKQVEDKENAAAVKAAYRKLLTEEKVSEKRLDSILKVTDFSKMKLDKSGNLENADELKKAIKEEWSEFVVSTSEKGATVENPPQTGKTKMTKEQIMAIEDTDARQKAIAENHEVFGF